MLEEDSFPDTHISGIHDSNFVTPVVFPRVPNVETSLGVGFVCLLIGGSDMHLHCSVERCKRIGIVVVLPIQTYEQNLGYHP